MTVAAQNTAVAYTGNGVTTVFAYTMRILDAAYLRVYLDGILQVAGYTVDNVGATLGGNVTFAVAPANGVAVLFQRATAQDQLVDYTPYDAFPSETHETALDKLTMLVQEGIAKADHAIIIPPNEATVTQLPSAAVRANGFVSFDGAGNVMIAAGSAGVPVTPFMATLLDDEDAPTARATLGVALTTKGDLLVGTGGSAVARRPVPADGKIMVADSAQGNGWRDELFAIESEVDIATAATPAIFAALTRHIRLTGTTNISAFDAGVKGQWRLCRAELTGALLVNGANLQNPIPFDIQMMAGDSFIVEALGGGVSKIHNYTRADGRPTLGGRIPFGLYLAGYLNVAASATNYGRGFGIGGAAAEGDARLIAPEDCTFSQLRLKVNGGNLAGGTIAVTLRKNGADTALVATINIGATAGEDLVNSVNFSQGDYFAFKVVSGAIGGGAPDLSLSCVVKKRGTAVGVPMAFCYQSGASSINDGVSTQSVGKFSVVATEQYAQVPVSACRIESRASYASVGSGGMYGTSLQNNLLPSTNESPSSPLIYDNGTRIAGMGVAGPKMDFVDNDMYSNWGRFCQQTNGANVRGWFNCLGATDVQHAPGAVFFHAYEQVQNVTRYMVDYAMGNAPTATESEVQIPMPACTLRNLRAMSHSAVAAGNTVLTVRKNGVDTGLTCSLGAGSRLASDTANSVVFAAGDLLSIKVVSGAATGTRTYNASVDVHLL